MPALDVEKLFPESIDGTHVFIFSSITGLYVLIRLLLKWIIAVNAVKLLSYLLTSFIIINLLLSGIVLTNIFQIPLLKIVLRILGVFGGCLALVHTVQYMWKRKKKRV